MAYRIPYVDVYTDDDAGAEGPYHTNSFINDGKDEDEFKQIESLCYNDEGDYDNNYDDAEVQDECSDESSTEQIPEQSYTPPVIATTISANRPTKPFRPQIPQDAGRLSISGDRESDRRQVPPPAHAVAPVTVTPYNPPKPVKPPRSPPVVSRIPGPRSSTPPLPAPSPPPLHSMVDIHSSKRPHSAIGAAAGTAAVSPEWRTGRYSSSPPDPPSSSPPDPPSSSPPYPPPSSSPPYPPPSSHTNRTMSVSTTAVPSPSHTNRTVSASSSAAPSSSSHTNRTMSVSTTAAPSPSHTNRTVSASSSAAPSSSSHANRTMSVSTTVVPSPSASIGSRGEARGPPSDCSEADSEDCQNSTLGTDDVSSYPDLELEFQDEHFFPRHPYGELESTCVRVCV